MKATKISFGPSGASEGSKSLKIATTKNAKNGHFLVKNFFGDI